MPIYEYRCLDCGHEFELMQKFSDPPAEKCTACPGTVQKLISRSAFHLKGDGWYVTDYARKGNTNGKSSAEGTDESDRTKTASTTTASNEGSAETTADSDTKTTSATASSNESSSKATNTDATAS